MNDLNSVLIEGKITGKPTRRTTPAGTAVCTFDLGSDRFYRNGPEDAFVKETNTFSILAKGKLADVCMNSCVPGLRVRVVGFLTQFHINGKPERMTARIVAEHVEFRPETAKTAEKEAADADCDN